MSSTRCIGIALPAVVVGVLTPLVQARCGSPQLEEARRMVPAPETGAPLAFVENRGQWDTPARFVAGRGLLQVRAEPDAIVVRTDRPVGEGSAQRLVIRLAFEGARDDVHLVGEERQAGQRNYFLGHDPARWRADVPAYSRVLYRGLHEGIDLRLREQEGRLEYDLLLAPNADLQRFAVRCEGVDGLSIEEDGSLVMETGLGPVRQSPPVTWQVLPDGAHEPLACHFTLLGGQRFGLRLERRLADLPVVIDPGLEWATYLGGTDHDWAYALAADSQGRAVLGGITESSDFDAKAGVFLAPSGKQDAFVAVLDPSLSGAAQLVWADSRSKGTSHRSRRVRSRPENHAH